MTMHSSKAYICATLLMTVTINMYVESLPSYSLFYLPLQLLISEKANNFK